MCDEIFELDEILRTCISNSKNFNDKIDALEVKCEELFNFIKDCEQKILNLEEFNDVSK